MFKDPYTKIDSKYILSVLKKTKWSNHIYVDELLSLKRYIEFGVGSFTESIHFHSLKNKYRKEFLELCKEYSFERYQKELEKQKNYEMKRYNDDNLKEDWIKAGGIE